MPGVEQVLDRGRHKAAVRLRGGPQVDLMIMPPGEVGTYLVHFTGSAAHNVRLRGLARDRGWSLSEHGFVRLGDDGRPLEGAAADRRTFATEAEVYAFLDLPSSTPELREDRGEIEAAPRPARCRTWSRWATCRATATRHSDWSDGHESIEDGGRGRAAPRLRLPGPDRPLAEPDHRQRPDHRRVEAAAPPSSPSSTSGSRARRRTARRPRARIPTASGCCTAARWRSASTAARLPRRAAGALRRGRRSASTSAADSRARS